MITQERLKHCLEYNPETGIFVWIRPPHTHPRLYRTIAGAEATGYIKIKIDNKKYSAHRLAWLYVYGEMPQIIDHKDGNSLNNALSNLRSASQAQNCANAARWRNKSLPKGVRAMKGRYHARISFQKKLIHIGCFGTVEEAAKAYADAASFYYGEFARAA